MCYAETLSNLLEKHCKDSCIEIGRPVFWGYTRRNEIFRVKRVLL
jgi:hypothetical protein